MHSQKRKPALFIPLFSTASDRVHSSIWRNAVFPDEGKVPSGNQRPKEPLSDESLPGLEITEKTGHGTVKIISAYGKEAYDIQDGFIQVTIPFNKKVMKNRGTINGNINGNINSDLSKNELSLIGVIIQKPEITLTEAAEILGVSKRTASRIFASLQEKGCVKREGSNKNGVWKVVK